MTKDTALRMALEALELTARDYREQRHAIAVIREALAQPEQDYLAGVPPMLPQMRDGETIVVAQQEQEPWPNEPAGHMAGGVQPSKMTKSKAITAIYALFNAPHNADINLTGLNKVLDELMAQPEQEEIERAMLEVWQDVGDPRFPHIAQPEQEPVAWGMMNDDGKIYDCICPEEHDRFEGEYTVPLYTTPPQHKPLTDEQWQVIADTLDCLITRKQKDAIEAVIGIKE